MKQVQTRKFIAIIAVLAWIGISLLCAVIAFRWRDKDLLTFALSSMGGTVGVIIGFYFGKSTAIEGLQAEHKMEEEKFKSNI